MPRKNGETATTPSRVSPRRKSKDEAARRIALICNSAATNEITHSSSSLDPVGSSREDAHHVDVRERIVHPKERAPKPTEFLVAAPIPSTQHPSVAYSGSTLSDPIVGGAPVSTSNVAPHVPAAVGESKVKEAIVTEDTERSADAIETTEGHTRASSPQLTPALPFNGTSAQTDRDCAVDQADVTEEAERSAGAIEKTRHSAAAVHIVPAPDPCKGTSAQTNRERVVDQAVVNEEAGRTATAIATTEGDTRASGPQVPAPHPCKGTSAQTNRDRAVDQAVVNEEAGRTAGGIQTTEGHTHASVPQVGIEDGTSPDERAVVTEQAERSAAMMQTTSGQVGEGLHTRVYVHHGVNMFTCATSRPLKQVMCVVASTTRNYKSSPAQENIPQHTRTCSTLTTQVEQVHTHNKPLQPAQVLNNADNMPPRTRRTPRANASSASASSATPQNDPSTEDNTAQEDTTHAHGQPQLPTPEDESDTVDVPIPPPNTNIRIRPTQGIWRQDGRSVRADRAPLDPLRLTGDHAWCHTPISYMSFLDFVVFAGAARRQDMQRWADLVEAVGQETAQALWREYTRHNTFYRVPNTIPLARTFVRSNLEAYYIDHMARVMEELPRIENIHDVPLFNLRDSMLSRWWNAFYTRAGHVAEADLRHEQGIFAPHDSLEIPLTDVFRLRSLYPGARAWHHLRHFPVGVYTPLPPSVFYFHDIMMNGTPEQRALLEVIFQLEHALLFAAHWWHMAARGGVGVVLPTCTINYLIRLLGDIPIDPDRDDITRGQVTFPTIAHRMREVRDAAQQHGNTVTHYGYGNLPSYRIVWTDMDGHVHTRRPGGRNLFLYRRQVQMREWLYRYESPEDQPVVTFDGDMRRIRRERMRDSIQRRQHFPDEDARPAQRVRHNPPEPHNTSNQPHNTQTQPQNTQTQPQNNSPPTPPQPTQAPVSRYINFDIRIHPQQWGVNDGDRNIEGRDFRPAQHRPPNAHWRAPVVDPASPVETTDAGNQRLEQQLPPHARNRNLTAQQIERLRDIRDRLYLYERSLGDAAEDERFRQAREARQEGRRGSRGGGPFASGRIAPRLSTHRLERQRLLFEAAHMLDAAQMTPDELMLLLDSIVERPASRDPFYRRNRDPNDDDDADHWGGGGGAGAGGSGFGGGGNGGMGGGTGGGNAVMV